MTKGNETEMPQVTCLGIHCDKIIKFPTHIEPKKFDGQVRCQECLSLMHIKLENSVVVKYSLIDDKSETMEGWATIARLKLLREKPEDKTE